MPSHYPTPWRTEQHSDAAWKAHIVDACGHNVILSVERSLADLIVEAVNARHPPTEEGNEGPSEVHTDFTGWKMSLRTKPE